MEVACSGGVRGLLALRAVGRLVGLRWGALLIRKPYRPWSQSLDRSHRSGTRRSSTA